jgi:hypothetical protein
VKVRGFAELTYRESARLSFARACERLDHDVTLDHPEAWVVDDRRISFSLEASMSPVERQLHQRLLEELCREAAAGDAYLAPEGVARWVGHAGMATSGIPGKPVSERTLIEEADTDITGLKHGS